VIIFFILVGGLQDGGNFRYGVRPFSCFGFKKLFENSDIFTFNGDLYHSLKQHHPIRNMGGLVISCRCIDATDYHIVMINLGSHEKVGKMNL